MIFTDIKALTKGNTYFRHVIYTGKKSQLVLMNILSGSEIGEETHQESDQIICIIDGVGEAIIEGQVTNIEKHTVVFVPAGTKHNIRNTGQDDLKLYTIYAPSTHAEGVIHKTKADAENE